MSEQLMFPAARHWPRRCNEHWNKLAQYLVARGIAETEAKASVLISDLIAQRFHDYPPYGAKPGEPVSLAAAQFCGFKRPLPDDFDERPPAA